MQANILKLNHESKNEDELVIAESPQQAVLPTWALTEAMSSKLNNKQCTEQPHKCQCDGASEEHPGVIQGAAGAAPPRPNA